LSSLYFYPDHRDLPSFPTRRSSDLGLSASTMSVSRIYLVGFMGSGKTTVGRRLAKKLGWKFIDLDEEIERRARRTVADIFRQAPDRKSTRLNSSHVEISYAVFCLKK